MEEKIFTSQAKIHLANPEHVLAKRLAVAPTDKLEVSGFSYRREQQLRLTSAAKTPKAASLSVINVHSEVKLNQPGTTRWRFDWPAGRLPGWLCSQRRCWRLWGGVPGPWRAWRRTVWVPSWDAPLLPPRRSSPETSPTLETEVWRLSVSVLWPLFPSSGSQNIKLYLEHVGLQAKAFGAQLHDAVGAEGVSNFVLTHGWQPERRIHLQLRWRYQDGLVTWVDAADRNQTGLKRIFKTSSEVVPGT